MCDILRVEVKGDWFIATIGWDETYFHIWAFISCVTWLAVKGEGSGVAYLGLEVYFEVLGVVAGYLEEEMGLFVLLLLDCYAEWSACYGEEEGWARDCEEEDWCD